MTGRKWYEWMLFVAYFLMIALCIFLNVYSSDGLNIPSLVVNIAMFVVVGIIFLSCDHNAFLPANRVIEDLDRVTDRIQRDADLNSQYLWETYRPEGENLFRDPILQDCYRDYLRETTRIAGSGKAYFHCDVGDFINEDLTEDVMHRNLMNQVPGALTGLGILGTFIGLSIGLQSFATGSTAEITNSIAPLMGGIRVAFHTSIYGMVFSLIFNYAFKRKLEEMEASVRDFLGAYRSFVLPDAERDGMNLLISIEKQQTEAIRTLVQVLTEGPDPATAEVTYAQAREALDEISGVTENLSAALEEAAAKMTRIDAQTSRRH